VDPPLCTLAPRSSERGVGGRLGVGKDRRPLLEGNPGALLAERRAARREAAALETPRGVLGVRVNRLPVL